MDKSADFENFCKNNYALNLTDAQKSIAKKLYTLGYAGGKSTLVALLYLYDNSARIYANRLTLK